MVLRVIAITHGDHCPECGQWSDRVHSFYNRSVQDVPLCSVAVVLRIRARKFFCDNTACQRRVFVEQFGGFLAPSQRKTARLNELITQIGFSLGGNPGATFCRHLGISVGKDTLLRRVKETPILNDRTVEVVGIDDWAYLRGQRYGTIVVDLESRTLVDLLPDRSVVTVANWLKAHPGIQVVSRDRAGIYADAIRQGLPCAIQVADRWHLLKNLGDTVERYLAHHRLPSREVTEPTDTGVQVAEPVRHSKREQELSARREQKWKRVQQVQELHQSGLGIRSICKQVGLSRKTIRDYLAWTEVPKMVRSPRPTLLDPTGNKFLN